MNTVAEPTATAVNPEQTICLDGQADTFDNLLLLGDVGNPTYQWFSNTTNTNSGGTAIAGATNSTYDTGVLSSIGTFYYYLEVTLDGTGCDLATSDVFTVNVVADPVIDTQAIASQEICQNTTLEALEVAYLGIQIQEIFRINGSRIQQIPTLGELLLQGLIQMCIILTIQPWGRSSIM